MPISFCTAIRNRSSYLNLCLPKTLQAIGGEDELCVLDWGSTDGLAPVSGAVWKRVENQAFFYMSKCKNEAHKLGTKDYLCNLDADNWVSKEWLAAVNEHLQIDTVIWSGCEAGNGGRLIIPRWLFYKVGGYDERMSGWGYEDVDLVERCKLLDARVILLPTRDFLVSTDAERWTFRNTNKWKSHERNKALSMKSIAEGRYNWKLNAS